MEIDKIKKKYCTHDKVQIMLSNASSEVICSKDGYCFFKKGDLKIYRYLTDPVRKLMPYHKNPVARNRRAHLFKYNQIYVRFTNNKYIKRGMPPYDNFAQISFLYFIKTEKQEAICAEYTINDFSAEDEKVEILSKEELEEFLYNTDGIDAKFIFEAHDFGGIQYVKHNNEEQGFLNEDFLDISDEGIIKKYNNLKKPMPALIFDEKLRAEAEDDDSWKVHSIEEIEDFTLTYHGFLRTSYYPVLIIIDGNEVSAYEFKVTFVEKDRYEIRTIKKRITFDERDILKRANGSQYLQDPPFEG